MGWLGWTEREVLASDVNMIHMALDSRRDMLNMLFGTTQPDAGRKPVTPADWQGFKNKHNSRYKRLDRRRAAPRRAGEDETSG